jgi:hypothetical protein
VCSGANYVTAEVLWNFGKWELYQNLAHLREIKIISKTMVMILLKKGAIVGYHYIYHWAQSIFKFKFSMDEVAENIFMTHRSYQIIKNMIKLNRSSFSRNQKFALNLPKVNFPKKLPKCFKIDSSAFKKVVCNAFELKIFVRHRELPWKME